MSFVQDTDSQLLLERFGISNVRVCGDTRIDRVHEIAAQAGQIPGLEQFVVGSTSVIIGGSTWPAEEELLDQFYRDHSEKFTSGEWKLIVAPHEVSDDHVSGLKKRFKEEVLTYGEGLADPDRFRAANVLIIDRIGLLNQLYQYGSVALIGVGFGKGIHNILEPAAFGLPVLFGPKHSTF